MTMFPVRFHPEAEQEYLDAARWYNDQKSGLNASFILCVDEALQRILRHPEMYSAVYHEKRRAAVKRFPYSIFYKIGKGEVRILSVFHSSRNPSVWQSRSL